MVSSLAAQLAQGVSVNASLLVNSSRRIPTESYLFSAKEAQQHDLDAVFALGSNGFLQLKSIDPSFRHHEQTLFSDAAKATDRTLLPTDANAQLNHHIASFLPLLGPYLMDAPAGKVIEWLVRRFRINEFNVEDILRLFLPYHESPHFTKMITILHINDPSMFRFLIAYKTTAKSLPRTALVTEMLKNSELSRFVSSMLPSALKEGGQSAHKAMVIFHTSILLAFVARNTELDEGTITYLLLAAMEPIQIKPHDDSTINTAILQESILGSLLILAAISQKCHLSMKVLKAIMYAVAACRESISGKQLVRTLLCICAPQDAMEKLPRAVIVNLLQIPDVAVEITEGLSWAGSEKLVIPLIAGLILQLPMELPLVVLNSILTYSKVPTSIVRRAVKMLLTKLIETEDPTDPALTSVQNSLSHLQQRHSRVVQEVCEAELKEDENKRGSIEQVVISLSMSLPGLSKSGDKHGLDAVVASVSADANVRAIAIRKMLNALSSSVTPASDMDSIKSALRIRVIDTDPSVIEALYGNPAIIVPILLEDALGYISSLVEVLHSPRALPSRHIVRLHLTFLANHFFSALSDKNLSLAERVVDQLFFPYLLFSKPRQKTAAVVWEILEAKENDRDDITGIGKYELLGGCADAVRWEQSRQAEPEVDDGSYRNVEVLARINLALAAKIADNILASNNYSHHFQALAAKLQDSDPHSRDLAYLSVRALLLRLSGEHQIDAAHQVLEAMKLESLEAMNDIMRGVNDLSAFLHDMSLGTAVVLKPNSRHTTHRLQVAVLTMLAVIPPPAGVNLIWLTAFRQSQFPVEQPESDMRAVRYVQLMRAVYAFANSTSSLPLFSTHLLRALFASLKDESLAFLAGIWASPPPCNGEKDTHVRVAALRHAAAFLQAHYATEHWVDFQTILPTLLIALQSTELRIREAAADCIAELVRLAQAKEVMAIYAYDTIYGVTSGSLQYVDRGDLRMYIDVLAAARGHILQDADYIRVLHQGHLSSNRRDSKKLTSYKQRIMCYLLSHVNACQLMNVRLSLLRSVETISNEVKCQVLRPFIESLLQEDLPTTKDPVATSELQELFVLLVSSFDASAAVELNDMSKPTWSTFQRLLRFCFTNGSLVSSRLALASQVERGLFSKLSIDRKANICELLIEIGVRNLDVLSECKHLLSTILTEVPVMMRLLVSFQPSIRDTAEPANKRVRLESAASGDIDDKLSSLSLLTEILASKSLPGSLDLITCLLETLNKVAHDASAVPADRTYAEQLLMNAVESAMSNMVDTNVPAGPIRVDILVELIRAADNPQTFHQALLLMASLARLAPDAVLHNVMPVFTFMGSNVFHRDDTYSFRVVQKTVENIVPVMIASLKNAHPTRLELYIGARDFLRIFTDASNHIPRHRRVKFYAHLVDVLGPEEFLAPICMLLVEKMSKRVVRQKAQDVHNSLSLLLNAFQHYSTQQHIMSLIEVLHEVMRLVAREADAPRPFLALPTDDQQNVESQALRRHRALALLIFCDHLLRELRPSSKGDREHGSSPELLSLLLRVAVLQYAEDGKNEIVSAARTAMTSTLRVMSASDFVQGVWTMVDSQDIKIETGALALLAERLPNVADSSRRKMTPTMVQIIDQIHAVLMSKPEEPLMIAALHALRSISQTACSGEESSLTASLPLVLEAIRVREYAAAAFAALLSLSSKLGPRVIPHLKGIVQECAAFLRKCQGDSDIVSEALDVLQNLLISVPTFWSENELIQVVHVYLDTCVTSSSAESCMMASVMRNLAKRIPSQVLLLTLCKIWSSFDFSGENTDMSKCIGYFHLMRRSLRSAARPVVLEHLRQLFNTFQAAFELNAKDKDNKMEQELLSSFLELVVKLNETAFRPLFRKLSDWAFTNDQSDDAYARAVTFCHVYAALLDYFKALMVPYMSFLWQPLLRLLNDYTSGTAQDPTLWLSVLETLTKTLTFDEGGFWRQDKLQQLVPALVKQIPICVQLHASASKAALSECLVATVEAINDDTLLKSLNMDILMHTRSDDARLRLLSLACSEALWRAHGGKLLGFVAETTTFIVESAEDENDSVVRAAHSLKDAVEGIAGKINA